jgi:Ni/Co efflux regulator RcnB
MNKITTSLIALAIALPTATPALAQHRDARHDQRHDVRRDDHRVPPRAGNPFRKGQRFDMRRAPNYAVVDYHRYRRLSAPPRGYHWVRSGNDALLVAIGSGIIASVVANSF